MALNAASSELFNLAVAFIGSTGLHETSQFSSGSRVSMGESWKLFKKKTF